jgi:hypothetical protein
MIKIPKTAVERNQFKIDIADVFSKLPVVKSSEVTVSYIRDVHRVVISAILDLDEDKIIKFVDDLGVKLPWWIRIALLNGMKSEKILEIVNKTVVKAIKMSFDVFTDDNIKINISLK